MSADTPYLSFPEEEPGFPKTANWQWKCHFCLTVNNPPPGLKTYGICRRCLHERCLECKVIWRQSIIEHSPAPLFRGTQQSITENRGIMELGFDRQKRAGGLGKGFISPSRKGVGGDVTGWLEGERKGQPEVKGDQKWGEFKFTFGGKHNG